MCPLLDTFQLPSPRGYLVKQTRHSVSLCVLAGLLMVTRVHTVCVCWDVKVCGGCYTASVC